jgi:hypothetical protein
MSPNADRKARSYVRSVSHRTNAISADMAFPAALREKDLAAKGHGVDHAVRDLFQGLSR